MNIAGDLKIDAGKLQTREDWAGLAKRLDVRTIHIAERDTQVSSIPKEPNEFVNTWSVDGFVSEGCQPAELGWGSHERNFPRDGKRFDFGDGAAIYLMQPGVATRVRSWAPLAGPYHGFLITHGEAISIADYLSTDADPAAPYRPSVHYSYHPSDNAVLSVHEFAGRNYEMQARKRIMMDDITTGIEKWSFLPPEFLNNQIDLYKDESSATKQYFDPVSWEADLRRIVRRSAHGGQAGFDPRRPQS